MGSSRAHLHHATGSYYAPTLISPEWNSDTSKISSSIVFLCVVSVVVMVNRSGKLKILQPSSTQMAAAAAVMFTFCQQPLADCKYLYLDRRGMTQPSYAAWCFRNHLIILFFYISILPNKAYVFSLTYFSTERVENSNLISAAHHQTVSSVLEKLIYWVWKMAAWSGWKAKMCRKKLVFEFSRTWPESSIFAHLTLLPPFMHLYLWGAESRDFGSIITGWVAADRKNRPICSSSFAAAADCGGRECFWMLFLLFNINNSLLLSSVVNVCFIDMIKWTICVHTQGVDTKSWPPVQSNIIHHNSSLCEAYDVDTLSLW